MSLSKKFITLAVCLVLIISIPFFNGKPKTLAGAGNGKNKEITDITEFYDFLNELNSSQSSVQTLSSESQKPIKKYRSYTMVESSMLNVDSSTSKSSYYRYNGSSLGSSSFLSNKFSMVRDLEIYYTEDAVFYKSVAKLVSTSTSSSKKSTGYSSKDTLLGTHKKESYDIKIQLYIKGEEVYLYFENLQYAYHYDYNDRYNLDNNKKETEKDTELGKQYSVLKKYRNQWIDCSSIPSIALSFIELNNSNIKSIAQISSILEQVIEDKKYTLNGDVYKLKNSVFKQFYGLTEDSKAQAEGNLSLDLSNATNPKFLQDNVTIKNTDSYSSKNEDVLGGTSTSSDVSAYLYLNAVTQFKNINNTVVKDFNEKTVDITDIIQEMEEE